MALDIAKLGLEVVGAAGALLLLTAYFFVTTGRWNRTSFQYHGANLAAALLLVGYGLGKAAYANIVLNFFWAAVAMFGIVTWVRPKRLKRR